MARAAVAADIGWVVLNHEADYLKQLRQGCHVPVFSLSSDHEEVGKIQGKQFAALLPQGGSILYIEGPANSSAAHERTAGMKPDEAGEHSSEDDAWRIGPRRARTAASVRGCDCALRKRRLIDLVGAQDDSMAAGARKAFAEIAVGERERWLKIPFTGCDGLPKTGQSWVRSGLLAATIFIRPNTDLALEMLTEAIRTGSQPAGEQTDCSGIGADDSGTRGAGGESSCQLTATLRRRLKPIWRFRPSILQSRGSVAAEARFSGVLRRLRSEDPVRFPTYQTQLLPENPDPRPKQRRLRKPM